MLFLQQKGDLVKKYLNLLQSIDLFNGMAGSEILSLLPCLDARTRYYEKGDAIFLSGGSVKRFGVVLSGRVQIIQEDFYGNRGIIAEIGAGGLFGESFAFAKTDVLPVSVSASESGEVLFLDSAKLACPCAEACVFHTAIIRNMLSIVSMKNITLTRKIEITSKRTTREKLLAYLSYEAKKAGLSSFVIPFNRQELADYLSVERSAMSAELSRLRGEGLLDYHKSRFTLL